MPGPCISASGPPPEPTVRDCNGSARLGTWSPCTQQSRQVERADASAEEAGKLGIEPRAEIVAYASSGIAPELVMMAPEKAVRAVWEKTGWSAADVDLYEFNEAFAVQQVALGNVLDVDPARHNVHGGAVALGHPIGASGARILTTLLHALEDRDKEKGIAALCLGGGNAVALAIRRLG